MSCIQRSDLRKNHQRGSKDEKGLMGTRTLGLRQLLCVILGKDRRCNDSEGSENLKRLVRKSSAARDNLAGYFSAILFPLLWVPAGLKSSLVIEIDFSFFFRHIHSPPESSETFIECLNYI